MRTSVTTRTVGLRAGEEFNYLMRRIRRVVRSCTGREQYMSACRYAQLAGQRMASLLCVMQRCDGLRGEEAPAIDQLEQALNIMLRDCWEGLPRTGHAPENTPPRTVRFLRIRPGKNR